MFFIIRYPSSSVLYFQTFVGIQDSAGVTLPKEIDNVVEKAAVLSPVKPLDLQLNGTHSRENPMLVA